MDDFISDREHVAITSSEDEVNSLSRLQCFVCVRNMRSKHFLYIPVFKNVV